MATPQQDDRVVADKFAWSDLIKKEDWWAIWLGFIIIACGVVSVTTGAFTFKAVKFPTWGNADNPTLFSGLNLSLIHISPVPRRDSHSKF